MLEHKNTWKGLKILAKECSNVGQVKFAFWVFIYEKFLEFVDDNGATCKVNTTVEL